MNISRSQVSKDVELQRLKENEEKLKSELLQRKQDIERYMFSHRKSKIIIFYLIFLINIPQSVTWGLIIYKLY